MEISILTQIREKDKNNLSGVVRIKDFTIFRNHIVTFVANLVYGFWTSRQKSVWTSYCQSLQWSQVRCRQNFCCPNSQFFEFSSESRHHPLWHKARKHSDEKLGEIRSQTCWFWHELLRRKASLWIPSVKILPSSWNYLQKNVFISNRHVEFWVLDSWAKTRLTNICR